MEPANRFSRCLLEQKNEDSRQARRLRRRTILIAILIQVILLGLLMLRPLLGASADRLMIARLIPLPPWRGVPESPKSERPRPASVHHFQLNRYIAPAEIRIPPKPQEVTSNSADAPDIGPITDTPGGLGPGDSLGLLPGIGLSGSGRPAPPAPPQPVEQPPRKPKLVPSEIQEARLITRVQPVYPFLAKQARLQGTVLIRAIIARDGSVESAVIVRGHPVLAQAARDAVLLWRYRPTLLNGQPVEVETLITVIFEML